MAAFAALLPSSPPLVTQELSRPSGASSFLLHAQEKQNQREGHPFSAPCGPPVRRVRVRWLGFSTAHPVLAKRRVHPCTRPCGPCHPPPTAAQGPRKSQRASCAPRERALPRTQHPRTGRPLGSLGPLWSGRGLRLERCRCAAAATRHARRDADTDVGVFSECTGCAPGKPRKPARTLPAGRRQSAEAGWPLFWFVFSGQTEKMNSRPIGRESS